VPTSLKADRAAPSGQTGQGALPSFASLSPYIKINALNAYKAVSLNLSIPKATSEAQTARSEDARPAAIGSHYLGSSALRPFRIGFSVQRGALQPNEDACSSRHLQLCRLVKRKAADRSSGQPLSGSITGYFAA
jgi:hypothetical protein